MEDDRTWAERQRQDAVAIAKTIDWFNEQIRWREAELVDWNRSQLRRAAALKYIDGGVDMDIFNDAPDVMSLSECAKLLGIHYKTAIKLARQAQLPVFRVGGAWRVTKTDLIAWIEAQQKPRDKQEVKS